MILPQRIQVLPDVIQHGAIGALAITWLAPIPVQIISRNILHEDALMLLAKWHGIKVGEWSHNLVSRCYRYPGIALLLLTRISAEGVPIK